MVIDKENIVAKTLYAEARGEGDRGMRAVATVIYNRAQRDVLRFADICLAPKQFSCWTSGAGFTVPSAAADVAAFAICLKIESEMNTGKFEPLGCWTHYYNPRLSSPSWAKGCDGKVIGNHKFLTLKK